MKIQVQRGDQVITLTPQEAEKFAFKAGDHVAVMDHGAVKTLTVPDGGSALNIAFSDGTSLSLPAMAPLLRAQHVVLALGDQAVLVDVDTGRPQTYALVNTGDDDGPDMPSPPGDMQVIPDVASTDTNSLAPGVIASAPRIQGMVTNDARHAGIWDAANADPYLVHKDAPARATDPHLAVHTGMAPADAPTGEGDDQSPGSIHNTTPGAGAAFANEPLPGGTGDDAIAKLLGSVPHITIEPNTPISVLPTSPPDTVPVVTEGNKPPVTPVQPTPSDNHPTPTPTPSPPPPPHVVSSGGSGGGGSSGGGPSGPPPLDVPVFKGLDPTTDTGISSTDAITSNAAPTLTGTAKPGVTVHILDGAKEIGHVVADTTGNWSFTPGTPLVDGSHAITVQATTKDGQASAASAATPLVIDTTAPDAPVVSGLTAATDAGASNTDGKTNIVTPTLAGTAEAGATVQVLDGGTAIGQATADAKGNWTFTPTAALTGGNHDFTATATDAAGNASAASPSVTVQIVPGPLAAPTITGLTAATDSGASSTDGITSNSAPTVTGTGPAGTQVQILDGTNVIGTVPVDASGNWSFTPTSALPEGAHSLTAKALDDAGNVSAAAAVVPVTVDATAPAAPVVTGLTAATDSGSSATDATTQVTTPTIAGTAEPGASVAVMMGGASIGTATADANGNWTLAVPGVLTDGQYDITAKATDAAGNVGPASVTKTLTIDTAAPAAPTISGLTVATDTGASNSDGLTDNAGPSLTGTAEAGAVVQVFEGGTLLGTTTADSNGNWTATLNGPLPDGSHSLVATATDPAGNASPASPAHTITVDATAPGAPVVTGLTSATDTGSSQTDGVTNVAAPVLTGTAEPNAVVTVFDGTSQLGTATADGSGNWQFQLPTLAEASHSLTATATDAAGNTSAASVATPVVVDTTAPAVPVIAGLTAATDTGIDHTDGITGNAAPSLTGTADAGSTVKVFEGGTLLGSATADANGTWTVALSGPLSDGGHNLTASATDAAGNSSAASTPHAITVITGGPAAPVITGLTAATDTGSSQTDGVTSVVAPTLSGTAEANTTVTVSDGATVLGTTTSDGSGNWQFQLPTLTEASHSLTATATDAVGNTGPSSTATPVVVDATAPVAPVITGLTVATDTGANHTDGITSDAAPTFVGTAEPNATVNVFEGSTLLGNTTADATGNWSFTPAVPFGLGGHTVTASQVDLAGNAGPSSAGYGINILNGIPAPIISGLTAATDTGSSNTDAVTQNTAPTITGTTSPNAEVDLFDGPNLLGSTTADASGNWSFTPAAPLTEGTHDITATATDLAGLTSVPSPATKVVVDLTAPGAPVVNGLTPATDTGASSVDNVTNNTAPTVAGTAEAGASVQVFDGATPLGTTTADASGNWTLALTTPLAEGAHAITAQATDAAGNVGVASTPRTITVMTTPPATPVLGGLATGADTGTSGTDGLTGSATPTITGTAAPNQTVSVLDGGTIVATTTADASGNWSVRPATPLADGPHSLTAVAVDLAGNQSAPTAPVSITVDAGAPTAPAITGLTAATDTGVASTDGITQVTTPTLAGTAEAGTTVQVYDGTTALGTATADGSGNWTLASSAPLAEGTHAVTATATDAAGNTSPASVARSVVVDLTAPAAPAISGLTPATDTGVSNTDGLTSNATPVLTGTAESGATVQITEGGSVIGTTTAGTDGRWSFTPSSALTDGTHVLRAVAVDAAGNSSASSTAHSIVVSTNAPAAPVVTGLTPATDTGLSNTDGLTADARPTVEGTATPNAIVQVFDGAAQVGTVQADGAGNWSFTPDAPLGAGTHPISAVAIDPAGNTSAPSAAQTITIDPSTTSPATISGLTAATDLGASSTDGITNVQTPTITGTAAPNAVVQVFDGTTPLGTATADSAGNWQLALTSPLAAGQHQLVARPEGQAGGTGATATVPITIDVNASGAPTIDGLTPATDTGSSNSDGLTGLATPTLTGSAEANATVTVLDGGIAIGTTTADGTGHWTFTPGTALGDGSHALTATATDLAGNVGPASIARSITIQTAAPGVPAILGLTPGTDTGASSSDGITSVVSPTVTGTADPGSTVNVYDGATLMGTAKADGAGSWSFTPGTALAAGNHSITATAVDPAGNTSASSPAATIQIVGGAVAAPVITGLTVATDTGASTTDGITDNATPTLTGTAAPNATVTILDGPTTLGTATADGSGNWTFTPPSPLADGAHPFSAVARDAAGNASAPSGVQTVTVDTSAPAVPTYGGLTAATDTGASSTDGVTSVASPTLTGTAEPGATVTILDGGAAMGTTTADATGAWTFTPTSALGNGSHPITVTATDVAGNTSTASASQPLTIQTGAAGVPTVTGLASATDTGASSTDGVTNDARPTVTGTAPAGSTVQVFDNGSELGTTTADGSGNWSFTPTTSLAEGSHAVTATSVDAAGHVSAASAALPVMVDLTAPAAAAATGLTGATDTGTSATDGITNNATPTLTGTAEAHATVQIFDGATLLGSTTADAAGNWTFTPTSALADGNHRVTAVGVDAAGNAAPASATLAVQIDTTAPTAPAAVGLAPATDTGLSNLDGVTSDNTPTIVGTAEPDAVVKIFDGAALLGTVSADAGGNWSLALTAPLGDGSHNVTATATDLAGNTSTASVSRAITIASTAPAAPVITGLTSATDSGTVGDGITSNATPAVTGTAAPNATVQILDGGTPIGSATSDGTGHWTFLPPTPLGDGNHSLTAIATDLVGSSSPASAARSIKVDTAAPATPAAVGLAAASDTGASATDGVTSVAKPTISGTGESGDTVAVFDGTTLLGTTTVDGSGNWSFTPTAALADGPHAVTVVATDLAGNTSAATVSQNLVVDTAAPTAPTIKGLTAATDTGMPADGVTNNATPTLTGTAEPNATVQLLDGGAPVATITADGNGNWSYTPATPLTTGSHAFTATAQDLAGNTSGSSTSSVVEIASTTLTTPVINGLTTAADTGASNNDGVTSNNTPTLTGTAPVDTIVSVQDGGVVIGTTTPDAGGNWSFTPTSGLGAGVHTITVSATDGAGNVSATSAPASLTVDVSAPAAPVITGLTAATDTGTSNHDGLTTLPTPTLAGTAEAGATVTILDGGAKLGTATADAGGNWTFTPGAPLATGQHTITATATDLAGNTSDVSGNTQIGIQPAAPGAPTIIGLTPATDTGSSDADGITSQSAPVLTGTAQANSTIQVFDGGVAIGNTTTDASGTWTYTPGALGSGAHVITVTATDQTGNVSLTSAAKSIAVDTTAPATPTISGVAAGSDTGSSSSDAVTYVNTPQLNGIAEAGAVITISDGGAVLGTTVADGSGNWSFTPGAMLDGTHTLTATAQDVAGNTSGTSASKSVTVDTVAPTTPVINGITAATDTGTSNTDGITGNTKPTITGTAEAGSSVQVFDGGTLLGTVTANGSGNWSYAPSTALSAGVHAITAVSTDTAGNVSGVSINHTVVIDSGAPAAPVVLGLQIGQDTGANPVDNITDLATPTIVGTAEPATAVAVFDGGVQVATVTADAAGNWSYTPASALTTNSHTFTAKATDGAGNVSPVSSSTVITISPAAPTAPVITGLTAATDSGSSSTDGTTNFTQPTLHGTAQAGVTVQLYDGTTLLGTTAADGSGNWSFTPGTALNEVAHTITAVAMDAAGNTSPTSAASTVTVDTTAPAAPIVSGLATASDTGISSTDNITNVTKPTITGTAEANATVTVYDGASKLGATTADGTGAWSYTPTVTLTNGSHAITATATDLAGNISGNATNKTITIDSSVPAAPVVTGLTAATDTGFDSTDSITQKTTPMITGTALASSTVQVYDNGALMGTTTSDSTGAWSYSPTTAFTEATHNITAKVMDSAGNPSAASATQAVVVDDTAPNAPTVSGLTAATDSGSSSTDDITNNPTPTINGFAEGKATVQVYDGGVLLGTTTAAGSGAWSLNAPTPMLSGVHTLTAKATDAAGNTGTVSASKSITIDTVAPGTPTVTGLAPASDTGTSSTDGITTDTTPTILGTADASTTVQIFDNGTLKGSTTSNASGAWTFTSSALTAGSHTITAKAVDTAGNTSLASAGLPVTIDSSVTAPTVSGLTPVSDTGKSASDLITSDSTPTILGTAVANSTVKVFSNGSAIGTTTADGAGSWSFTPTLAMGSGAHSITATATDAAGVTSSASTAKSVTIDTTAPSAPSISGLATTSDTGTSSTDRITADTTPTITGTAEANATVQVLDGTLVLGTTTATSTGTWSFTSPSLAGGVHSLTATAIDAAGNQSSASTAKSVTIVDTPPVPVVVGLAPSSDTGVSNTDSVTKDTTPTIIGTAQAGTTVQVLDFGVAMGTAVANSSGNWTFTPTTAMSVSTHSVTAKAVDAAGGVGSSSPAHSITVDNTAATITSVSSTTANGTYAPGTNIPITVLFNTAMDVDTTGGVPTLLLATGTTQEKAIYTSGSGTTTLTFTYQVQGGDSSADLNYVATNSLALNGATITDAAGNSANLTLPGTTAGTSLGGAKNLVITGTPGATPVVLGLTPGTDSGTSANDGVTNDSTPTIMGVATAGASVKVLNNGAQIGTATANANGDWTFTPTTALTTGAHSITAQIGSGTVSAAKSITIDSAAPTAPVVSGLTTATDTGTSSTDGITTNTTPTITGTATANTTIDVYDGTGLIGSTTAGGTGAWSLGVTTALLAGTHSITAKATDSAGNTSVASTAKTITIDSATPAAPTITGLATASDTGTSNTDGITTDSTPTMNGTAAANTKVEIHDGTALLGSTTASSTGAWSFTPTSALATGSHSITATAVSTGGNESSSSAAKTVMIESASMATPVISGLTTATDTGSSSTDGDTNVTKPTFVGTAAPDATVQILDGTTVLGSTTADGSGDWTFTPTTALTAATHSITAKASDSSGSTATSSVKSIIIDTTGATVSSVTSSTPNGTLGIGDTASIQVKFSSTVDVNLAGGTPTLTLATGTTQEKAVYASGSSSNTLTFTYTVQPGDSSTDLNYASTTALSLNGATITDVAGNTVTLTLPATTASTSLAGSKTLAVDTSAPTAPTIAFTATSDTGVSNTDGITNKLTPGFTGTAEAGSTVQIYVDGSLLGTTTASGGGTYSTIPGTLTAGFHTITAVSVDKAGNVSPEATPFIADIITTPPTVPVITGLTAATDKGSSSTDSITNLLTPTLEGTGQVGSTITVKNGAIILGTTTVDSSGNWTFTLPNTVGVGTHTLTASASDDAGNNSTSSGSGTVTIDTTAPAAPVVSGLTTATDTGTSNTDDITSNTRPAIQGTAENSATVSVYDGAVLLGTTTASSTGAWTFTPSTPLASGNHAITAKAMDVAGNTGSASASKTITIDAAPAAPVITGLTGASDTGVSSADQITSDTTPTITGTTVANATVQVFDGTTSLGTTAASASGAWSFTPSTALSQTAHSITAKATDTAGNVSAASEITSVTIDTTAPGTAVVLGLSPATDTGSSRTDGLTMSSKPTLVGTAEAGATVQIFDGATQIGTTTADATGNWSYTPTTALTQVAHGLAAKAVDVAGNAGSLSTAFTVTVDTTAPGAPVITGLTAATDTGKSSIDATTHNASPTVTGTAEANATVQIFDNAILIGSTTADSTGAWTFTPTSPLTDGTHPLTAKATDAAGNVGVASTTRNVVIDTLAPTAPAITGLTAATDTGPFNTDGVTSVVKPSIAGTAEANTTVSIYDGGTLLGTTVASASGNWSYTPSSALTTGAHNLTAVATDTAGNASPSSAPQAIVIMTGAPNLPVIDGLSSSTDTGASRSDGVTLNATPTLIGTADPNVTIQVYDGGGLIGTTTANGSGAWTFTPSTVLVDGPHNVTVKAVDLAGNTSAMTATTAIVVDTVAPATPVITGLTAATDTGTSNTDGITSNATPTLAGTSEANAIIQVSDSGVVIGTTQADASGNWAFTPDTALANGVHPLTVVALDTAGNASSTAAASIEIRTATPGLPILTGLTAATDTGASSTDGITSIATPTLTGTATAGSIVTILDGATAIGTTTADASGNWTFVPSSNLTEGSHSLTATAAGLEGKSSAPSAPEVVVVDMTAPVSPLVIGLTPATDTGVSSTDGATTVTAPTIMGTAEAGATVTVSDGATVLGTTTADASGNWTFTPGSALADGAHPISAVATDAAGNASSASTAYDVAISAAPAVAPVIVGLTAATDTGVSSTDGLTRLPAPTIAGTAAANSTVKIFDGASLLGTTTADGSGNWTYTPAPLADGVHSLTASFSDLEGHVSPTSAVVKITVDSAAPAAAVVTAIAASTDTGTSSSDGITSNTTPILQGTAEPNATVTVFDNGTAVATQTADGVGAWSYTPATPLAEGTHTFTAGVTDQAGNVGPSSSALMVTVDVTAPAVPTVYGLTPATDTGVSNTDGQTSNATPTITGSAEANAKVSVFDNGALLGTTTADATGAWSFTPSTSLSDAAHPITAVATDTAGNASAASAAHQIIVNSTGGAMPIVAGLTAATDLGASNTDGITADPRPTIVGTGAPGSIVTVTDGGATLGSTTADSSGNWSFTPTTALVDGNHAITATFTDLVGHTSPTSPTKTITVDTAAPASPVVTGLVAGSDSGATDGITNVTKPAIAGTAEAQATVTVLDGGAVLGTTTADNTGAWAFTPSTALAEGSHPITAIATDAAGNASSTANGPTIVVDTTAPAAPVLQGLTAATDTGVSHVDGITSVGTPTLLGSAEPGAVVTVKDGTITLGSTTADVNGAWSFTPTTALSQGGHDLTATATDLAANTGAASVVDHIVITAPGPTAPVISGLLASTDTGASSTDGLTRNAAPVVTGVASPSTLVTVFDGAIQLGTTTADTSGNWSFRVPVALTEGAHAITATATDAAGNTGTASAALAVTVDLTSPATPVFAGLTPATDTGTSNSDGITSNTSPTLMGTAEAGATVQAFDGTTLLGSATADASGNWTLAVGTPMTTGGHNISVVALDAAGNQSAASTPHVITIQAGALPAPVIAGLTPGTDTGASQTDGVTSVAAPTIVGSAAGNTTITVNDGGIALGTTTADASGQWSFTPTAALTAGVHNLTATASDATGDTSAVSAGHAITITATAPGAPTVTGLTAATDTGASNTDAITSDVLPTVTGTATASTQVNVFDGATLLGSTTANGAGQWSFAPPVPLAQGAHVITATAVDAAGNAGTASAPVTVMVDATAPGAPVVSGLTPATDTGTSNSDGITSNALPTIAGTAEAGAVVTVYDGASALGTTTADASGNWTYTPSAALAQGSHAITASATDVAGNLGATSAAVSVEIAVSTPHVPVVSGLTPSTDTGASQTDGLTTNASPTIVGLADAGAAVQVFDGGVQIGSTTATAGGTWSFTPAAALIAGAHVITATETPTSGATSAASASDTITIVSGAPAAPVLTGLTAATDSGVSHTDALTNVAAPTLQGTAIADATVQVFDGSNPIGTTVADGSGNWSFTPSSPLADGAHALTATAMDASGAVSGASTALDVTINTAAPAAPVVGGLTAGTDTGSSTTDGITHDATPAFAGTAAANALVTVYDGNNQLGTTTADATGAWSFTPGSALTEGHHSIAATARDAAGNVSQTSPYASVVVDLTPPGLPSVLGLTPSTDTGTNDHDGITANNTPTILGTAEANSTVTVLDGTTQLGTTAADATGHWSFTPSAALLPGTHAINASATDAAGNAGAASGSVSITVEPAGTPAPYRVDLPAAHGGLWFGDFEQTAAPSSLAAPGGPTVSLGLHDVLAMPTPAPNAAPMIDVHVAASSQAITHVVPAAAPPPPVALPPEVATVPIVADLLRHLV